MKVLIVAKTHMHGAACVGGMVYDTGQSVRLLQTNGRNQPEDTAFEVGHVWDIDFEPHPDPIPPHVEDVLVHQKRYLGKQLHLREFITRRIDLWRGQPQNLFDGLIRFTEKGSGYISKDELPNRSTGYWIPDRPLFRIEIGEKIRYRYVGPLGTTNITYVGFHPSVEQIPEGNLVRVSLARWWAPYDRPEMEERCYLQLSGWY